MKLTDVFEIRPSGPLLDLSRSEKVALMDSVLNVDNVDKRGLLVTFNLSSSARRINNRIYTPVGQSGSVHTWTTPYPKPIIRNHDQSGDPIGRFVSVEWESTDNDALRFFKNAADFMQFKRLMDSNDPKKIYRALRDRHLLTNEAWPGLGHLVAAARISDEKAVERFLDKRYLTFSAGTSTDRYCCGICGDDWAQGEICDHLPGKVHEDGMIGTFVTGKFKGVEASVVNSPANTLSAVRSLEFIDSNMAAQIPVDALGTDSSTIYFTDAHIDTGASMEKKTLEVDELLQRDALELVQQLDEEGAAALMDALTGETHFEVSWLVRVHDALHHEHDFALKYTSQEDRQTPQAVFGLHGKLHELAMSQGFRDSLLNGPLDGFDSEGGESTEYMLAPAAEDSEEEPKVEDQEPPNTDAIVEAVVAKLAELGIRAPAQTEEPAEQDEKSEEEPVAEDAVEESEDSAEVSEDDTHEPCSEDSCDVCQEDTADVPWELLDLAMQTELGDAKLSAEARKELKADAFCGPDRSFPVPDCAHVTAARRLVGRAKLSEDQKKRVLACVDRKAKSLGCDSEDGTCDLPQTDSKLQEDYAQALKQLSDAHSEIEILKNRLAELDSGDANVENEDEKDVRPTTDDIKPVENPTVGGSETTLKNKLGDFENKFIKQYTKIFSEDGAQAANLYYLRNRHYLPRGFNISQYIQEND